MRGGASDWWSIDDGTTVCELVKETTESSEQHEKRDELDRCAACGERADYSRGFGYTCDSDIHGVPLCDPCADFGQGANREVLAEHIRARRNQPQFSPGDLVRVERAEYPKAVGQTMRFREDEGAAWLLEDTGAPPWLAACRLPKATTTLRLVERARPKEAAPVLIHGEWPKESDPQEDKPLTLAQKFPQTWQQRCDFCEDQIPGAPVWRARRNLKLYHDHCADQLRNREAESQAAERSASRLEHDAVLCVHCSAPVADFIHGRECSDCYHTIAKGKLARESREPLDQRIAVVAAGKPAVVDNPHTPSFLSQFSGASWED